MKRILLIEDEEPLADALYYTLDREGFDVEVSHDGAAGLDRFLEGGFDLVVLDLMLPSMDGLEVCRRIRTSSAVPILMLTAKDSEVDEVVGLELGADDYITKPFSTRNLVARIRAVLRRADKPAGEVPERLACGDLVMECDKHEVFIRGEEVHLTPIEYRILEGFMRRPGKALAREFLLNSVWEGDFFGSPKTLDVHIRHLREKLEEDPASPAYIRTVRGLGYRLEVPGPSAGER